MSRRDIRRVMPMDREALRARVELERRLRFSSDREAAAAGGVANTTWSRFMQTGEVTSGIRRAVATAFGWSMDWPENPPPSPVTPVDEREILAAEIAAMRRELERVVAQLGSIGETIEATSDAVRTGQRTIATRLKALERQLREEAGDPRLS